MRGRRFSSTGRLGSDQVGRAAGRGAAVWAHGAIYELDGGIDPEIKAQIRAQVEAYQREVSGDGKRAPQLNNNDILKKTVVPHLTKILRAEGKTGDDLNALCRALALEGSGPTRCNMGSRCCGIW